MHTVSGIFAADRHDVSPRGGERVPPPAVRGLDEGTLLGADRFSCREQIEQTTGRSPLRAAELPRGAIRARDARRAGRA